MRHRSRILLAVAVLLVGATYLLAPLGCHKGARRSPSGTAMHHAGGPPTRAIWITRWDYKSAGDIARIMEDCKRAGFNTVLFQVRGNGTAFYRSRLEPWAEEFGGRDPGFDPLAVACAEGHRRRLEVHAWANVIPGWRGKKPPSDPQQLYHARADWFWRDAHGRREPLGWYNNLNPCLPEVRAYLTDVLQEIVAGYPIDGLHLDYIRFPNEINDGYPRGAKVPDYPRDPRTLALYRAETGLTPDQSPPAWDQWRTDKVTRLVIKIRQMQRETKPGIKLTAAVGADPVHHKKEHFQDSVTWLQRNLVDAVYPMNYASDMKLFTERSRRWRQLAGGRPVVMGIMFDDRDPRLVNAQMGEAIRSVRHFGAFAYNSVFERPASNGAPAASRMALQRQVIPNVQRLASIAP